MQIKMKKIPLHDIRVGKNILYLPGRMLGLLTMLVFLSLIGCATQRIILPKISEAPRSNLRLGTPVLISVLDARTTKEASEEVIASLKNGLSQTYGNSIQWIEFFEEVPSGRVAVKIRLKANEANFGSRIISAVSVKDTFTTVHAQVSYYWNSLVATALARQTTLGTTFVAEGWWVGTAWLQLEIHDTRGEHVEQVSLPIVAEQKESNTWGYRSGDKAARKAWNSASQQLIQILDAILIMVRDQE
jgi:hypothetical protein